MKNIYVQLLGLVRYISDVRLVNSIIGPFIEGGESYFGDKANKSNNSSIVLFNPVFLQKFDNSAVDCVMVRSATCKKSWLIIRSPSMMEKLRSFFSYDSDSLLSFKLIKYGSSL